MRKQGGKKKRSNSFLLTSKNKGRKTQRKQAEKEGMKGRGNLQTEGWGEKRKAGHFQGETGKSKPLKGAGIRKMNNGRRMKRK